LLHSRTIKPWCSSKRSLSFRPGTLAGKRLGFLDNTKANFELLLRRMEALLRAETGLSDVVYERKANSSTPAPPEVLQRLREVDLVVTGSAD